MDERSRETEGLHELFQGYFSVWLSLATFWAVMLFWNFFNSEGLELMPRFGLAASLSWGVFLIAEVIGVIIMTLMKDKWQTDARNEARFEALEEVLKEVRAEARESRARDARTQETVIELMRRIEKMGGGQG